MLICGLEGTGKSLLLSAIAVEKMLNCQLDTLDSYDQVRQMNELGFELNTDYEHMVFCAFFKINTSGTEIPHLESYKLNPYRLGLYSPDYETDFYPPGSWFFIPEAQRVFNSYKQFVMRPEFFGMFETSRQAGYSLILDCQRPILIAKNVRDLVNRFIILHKKCSHIYNNEGVCIGHKLYIKELNSNKDIEYYESTGEFRNAKEYVLVLDRCYFDNYDSYFFRYFHYKGRLGQDFHIEKWESIESVEDIEAMGEESGMTPPPGFYLEKTKNKSQVENEEDNSFEEYLD